MSLTVIVMRSADIRILEINTSVLLKTIWLSAIKTFMNTACAKSVVQS